MAGADTMSNDMPQTDPAMGADPMATTDPAMTGDAEGLEPEEDAAVDDVDNAGDTSEIDDIWGQLDTEDKSALLKYGKSMLDSTSDEESSDTEMPEEATEETQAPMMESVILTKRQLRKMNKLS